MVKETKVKAPLKANRGFAAMDPVKQREIASKGGQAVAKNREHMAAIGAKGGEVRSKKIAKSKECRHCGKPATKQGLPLSGYCSEECVKLDGAL